MTATPFLAATFLGAFLLFQIQPLAARALLPTFGGTPAVWTTSMLFFQLLLVAGYAWGHFLSTLSLALRRRLQLALAASALLALAASALRGGLLLPDRGPVETAQQQTELLLRLGRSVGLPYLVAATTGPVVQSWWFLRFPDRSPYRLYALSNLGSLAGLITYPLLVEPLLGLRGQAVWWSALFVVFLVAVVFAARGLTPGRVSPAPTTSDASLPSAASFAKWLALAAIACVVLLAATNQLCQDVASIPLLWVLPLSLYLISFILAFDRPAWYERRVWVALAFASIVGCSYLAPRPMVRLVWHVLAWSMLVLSGGMVCHGELNRARPDARHLTRYYLAIALGGAAGGLFVALLAPRIFRGYHEVHIALTALLVVAAVVVYALERKQPLRLALLALAGAGIFLVAQNVRRAQRSSITHLSRSFFGVLRVTDDRPGSAPSPRRFLSHGSTLHGLQYTTPARRREPTSYYGPTSGLARLIETHPRRASGLNIGVCGLGAGTTAAYVRANDTLRYYEIDPDVVALSRGASPYFTFLHDAPGQVDVVVGDARVSLERELAQGSRGYDVLAVDAFSSDSIPIHLLTREAITLYVKHLAPGGVLAMHVTNRNLDLVPVVRATVASLGYSLRVYDDKIDYDAASVVWHSTWVLVAPDAAALAPLGGVDAPASPTAPWTDDYSNVIGRIRL